MNEPIFDAHAHIWLGRAAQDTALLRRAAERYGIQKIYISCLGSHTPDPAEIEECNRQAARLLSDPLFGGYVTVAPEQPGALEVLRRGAEEQGFAGMKIWVSCLCDEPCCDPLYDYCGAWGLPVLIHTFAKTVGQLPGESTAVHLRRAALRHPKAKFLMAHLGGNCYHGLPMVQDLPNVWVDFSGSNCRFDDLPYALELLGSERVVFGTDMTGSFAMSYGQVLALPQEARRKILWENAQALFNGRDGNAL